LYYKSYRNKKWIFWVNYKKMIFYFIYFIAIFSRSHGFTFAVVFDPARARARCFVSGALGSEAAFDVGTEGADGSVECCMHCRGCSLASASRRTGKQPQS
jgi:hypothetical protein